MIRFALVPVLVALATPAAADLAPPLVSVIDACATIGPDLKQRLTTLEQAGWELAQDSRTVRELKGIENGFIKYLWFIAPGWERNFDLYREKFATMLAEPEREVALSLKYHGPEFSAAAVVADLRDMDRIVLEHQDVPGVLTISMQLYPDPTPFRSMTCSLASADMPALADLRAAYPAGAEATLSDVAGVLALETAVTKGVVADGSEGSSRIDVINLTTWDEFPGMVTALGSETVPEMLFSVLVSPLPEVAP